MFTVDVWHCPASIRPRLDPRLWSRYRVAAGSAADAELTACQMAATRYGTAVASIIIDWD